MSLTELETNSINHPRRVWEARKFCQVKPNLVQYARNGGACAQNTTGRKGSYNHHKPDAALTALLRGVLDQLSADLVMISLLDDHTQYFVAGATEASRNDCTNTFESAQWYGCDHVTHHGGLCERTIAIRQIPGQPPALYEVLDLSAHEQTRCLPFVDGTLAAFRHYIGSPIATPEGYNIGTVFAFSRYASPTAISLAQQIYLHETSKQVMAQLTQAMQALEGRRAARYNAAVTSLLSGQAYKEIIQIHARFPGAAQPEIATRIYNVAAELLRNCFGLTGLIFQDVSLFTRVAKSSSGPDHNTVLASSLQSSTTVAVPVDVGNVQKLLELFPQGGIMYADVNSTDETFSDLANGGLSPLEPAVNAALKKSFPGAVQILFAPLWDAVHSRTTAVCFGWIDNDTRIFESENDLPALTSFCMTTMSHVQRMESLHLDQVKSDFLGSISHETRTPLHIILGNLELLLGTDCDDEQQEMLVNARFGATQLLGSIDKILQYSQISRQPASVSRSSTADHHSTPDAKDNAPEQDEDQVRDNNIVQIEQRCEGEGVVSGYTDLIGLCEEIVEDVAQKLRLSDTIMSPEAKRRSLLEPLQNPPQKLLRTISEGQHDGDGHFSIIMFDARSVDNCQVPGNSTLRIILENLLSNAIKFTRIDCCVRCSLTLTPAYAEFKVIDCGRGFSPNFLKHSLYVPFSQQNAIDEGMGLGMSLIKQNIEELEGTIHIDSEQTLGTTVTMSLPIQKLTQGLEQQSKSNNQGRGGTALMPKLRDQDGSDLPQLKACIYAPLSWMTRYDDRDKRSIGMLRESLRHTLGAWFRPVLSVWQEVECNEENQTLPDLIFVIHRDVERFRQTSSKKFRKVKTIVICADVGKNSKSDYGKIEAASFVADAIITGSVVPSKLWKTVTLLFPHVIPSHADNVEKSLRDLGIQDHGERERVKVLASDTGEENLDQRSTREETSDDNASRSRDANPSHLKENSLLPRFSISRRSQSSAHRPDGIPALPRLDVSPRVLLVDDNAVNSKLLGAFLKKSGVPTVDQKSASGGQEAIDVCNLALQKGGGPHFDIIFMDLSMPEVSGFDATAAIRRMEDSKASKGAYIVALSGLVSDKDRDAAFAAGVNDFVSKPAGVKNVQGAIAVWKSNLGLASATSQG